MSDEWLADTESIEEALFDIACWYGANVTANEPRVQDGVLLMHVGDFIGDVKDAFAWYDPSRAERDALRAEIDRLHSWDGLMELLDEHWPEGLIPTLEDTDARDPGPRIVSLLRWVRNLRAKLDAVAKLCDDPWIIPLGEDVNDGVPGVKVGDLRTILDGEETP